MCGRADPAMMYREDKRCRLPLRSVRLRCSDRSLFAVIARPWNTSEWLALGSETAKATQRNRKKHLETQHLETPMNLNPIGFAGMAVRFLAVPPFATKSLAMFV